MEILKDQELFRTVNILGAKYTVIYRSSMCSLILKSEGFDQIASQYYEGTLSLHKIPQVTVNLYMPSCNDEVAITWCTMSRRRAGSKYLVCSAIRWFDQPRSHDISLAIPEEITDINVERSLLALFCSHLQECEDRFAYFPTLKDL